MQDKVDNGRKQGRTTRVRVLISLVVGACVTLIASECSKSHVQETVTVAPRAATTQAANATTDTNSSVAPPAVDIETEAAGDAIAHAIVALKTRRRDEALYYMNLARTRLTRILNRSTEVANANSNSTRERLVNDLRELDIAEQSANHNAYDQSRAQLRTINNELDHLH